VAAPATGTVTKLNDGTADVTFERSDSNRDAVNALIFTATRFGGKPVEDGTKVTVPVEAGVIEGPLVGVAGRVKPEPTGDLTDQQKIDNWKRKELTEQEKIDRRLGGRESFLESALRLVNLSKVGSKLSIDEVFEKAGFVNVYGVWIDPAFDGDLLRKIPKFIFQLMRAHGIRYIIYDDIGHYAHGSAANVSVGKELVKGVILSNRSIGFTDAVVGHVVAHEVGHGVWDTLTDEQKNVFKGTPQSDYANRVKKGEVSTGAPVEEEEFAEQFARNVMSRLSGDNETGRFDGNAAPSQEVQAVLDDVTILPEAEVTPEVTPEPAPKPEPTPEPVVEGTGLNQGKPRLLTEAEIETVKEGARTGTMTDWERISWFMTTSASKTSANPFFDPEQWDFFVYTSVDTIMKGAHSIRDFINKVMETLRAVYGADYVPTLEQEEQLKGFYNIARSRVDAGTAKEMDDAVTVAQANVSEIIEQLDTAEEVEPVVEPKKEVESVEKVPSPFMPTSAVTKEERDVFKPLTGEDTKRVKAVVQAEASPQRAKEKPALPVDADGVKTHRLVTHNGQDYHESVTADLAIDVAEFAERIEQLDSKARILVLAGTTYKIKKSGKKDKAFRMVVVPNHLGLPREMTLQDLKTRGILDPRTMDMVTLDIGAEIERNPDNLQRQYEVTVSGFKRVMYQTALVDAIALFNKVAPQLQQLRQEDQPTFIYVAKSKKDGTTEWYRMHTDTWADLLWEAIDKLRDGTTRTMVIRMPSPTRLVSGAAMKRGEVALLTSKPGIAMGEHGNYLIDPNRRIDARIVNNPQRWVPQQAMEEVARVSAPRESLVDLADLTMVDINKKDPNDLIGMHILIEVYELPRPGESGIGQKVRAEAKISRYDERDGGRYFVVPDEDSRVPRPVWISRSAGKLGLMEYQKELKKWVAAAAAKRESSSAQKEAVNPRFYIHKQFLVPLSKKDKGGKTLFRRFEVDGIKTDAARSKKQPNKPSYWVTEIVDGQRIIYTPGKQPSYTHATVVRGVGLMSDPSNVIQVIDEAGEHFRRRVQDADTETGLIESGQAVIGPVGGNSNRGRRDERLVDDGDLPPERFHVGAGDFPTTFVDEAQRRSVNYAIEGFLRGARGFLLGDGPGSGKTRTVMLFVKKWLEMPGLKQNNILIVMPKVNLPGYRVEARRMNVDLVREQEAGRLTLITYEDLINIRKFREPIDGFSVVIFEEAQNLRSIDAKRSEKAEGLKAEHRMYVTATPLDRIDHAFYFLPRVAGRYATLRENVQEIEDKLGIRVEETTDADGNQVKAVKEIRRGTTLTAMLAGLVSLRKRAVEKGLWVRRYWPFWGDIHWMSEVDPELMQMSEKEKIQHNQQLAWHQKRIANKKLRGASGQRT